MTRSIDPSIIRNIKKKKRVEYVQVAISSLRSASRSKDGQYDGGGRKTSGVALTHVG